MILHADWRRPPTHSKTLLPLLMFLLLAVVVLVTEQQQQPQGTTTEIGQAPRQADGRLILRGGGGGGFPLFHSFGLPVKEGGQQLHLRRPPPAPANSRVRRETHRRLLAEEDYWTPSLHGVPNRSQQLFYQQRQPPPPHDYQVRPLQYPSPPQRPSNNNKYALKPPPPPPASYVLPPLQPPPKPVPECFIEETGYRCCNREMLNLMKDSYFALERSIPNFHRCNTQKIANTIQKALEDHYGGQKFEVAVGLSDFASTSHYTGNYLCKTRQMDRFLLAYGTPHW